MYEGILINDANICFEIFNNNIQSVFNIFFPVIIVPDKQVTCNIKKWYTPELRNLSKMLHEMRVTNKRINNPYYNSRYKQLRKFYNDQIKIAKKTYNSNRIKNAKNISQETWKIIKENNPSKYSSPNLTKISCGNKVTTDQQEISENFNSYFANFSNGCDPPKSSHPTTPILPNTFFLSPTTAEEVERVLGEACQKKSAGSDEIPGKVCLAIKELISPILSQLINLSFLQGKYPNTLKNSKIVPIFKNKGSPLEVENYRPIALQCQFAKFFEKCFNNRLTKFLEKYSLISSNQNGFIPNYSTNTALDAALQHIYDSINHGDAVMGLLFDMSRAFDTVDHDFLVQKLNNIGIRGPANDWIKSYLSDRTQQVVIGSVKSSTQNINRGIPQGSCLSPTLFNCYINDLPNNNIPNTRFILYAGDTNILITSKNRSNLPKNSISGIEHVSNWCENNGIKLNNNKTLSLEVTTKNAKINSSLLIKIESKSIENVSATKFLGICIDRKLTWSDHIDNILPKLSSCTFLIQNIRDTVSVDVLRLAYFGLFQSVIAYGIIHWGSASHADRIFVAQKRVIRCMSRAKWRDSCPDLFKRLEVMTFPCIYIYALLLYVRNNIEGWTRRTDIHTHDTRYKNNLNLPFSRLSISQQSPQYIGLKVYNRALTSYRCFNGSDSLVTYRSKIKSALISKCFYSVEQFFS